MLIIVKLLLEHGAKQGIDWAMSSAVFIKNADIIKVIYFLSFERSELEGKYSLIVSVYACMHCVWEIIVCRHSGDAGLCVYVACMDSLAQQRAGGYLKWML